LVPAVLAAAVALSGCFYSRHQLSSDFGRAERQDLAAQIADPDAQYVGDPAPGALGSSVGLAQGRYQSGKVTKPTTATSGGNRGGGGGGGDSSQ
jgi:hypothetical protein